MAAAADCLHLNLYKIKSPFSSFFHDKPKSSVTGMNSIENYLSNCQIVYERMYSILLKTNKNWQ